MGTLIQRTAAIGLALALCAGSPNHGVAGEVGADRSAADKAVGRLNHAGFRDRHHCTVAAVGPHLLLSAAHCVAGVPPSGLHLLLGYDRAAWDEMRQPSAVRSGGTDVAALCVDEPLSGTIVAGAADAPVGIGARVEVIGYSRPKVHAQQRHACTVLGASGAFLSLDCVIDQGGSGAPVVADGAVVAIVIAKSDDRQQTLAERIPPDLLSSCAAR